MLDPKEGDLVLFYQYSSPNPGPYPAKVLAVHPYNRVDLEVMQPTNYQRQTQVSHRHTADTGRMWDWPNADAP